MSFIPSIAVRYKDYLVSGSYFVKNAYSGPDFRLNYFDTNKNVGASVDFYDLKADRQEYDINVGYYFIPGVAVSFGYKKINLTYEMKAKVKVNNVTVPLGTQSEEITLSTPTIGLQAYSRLGDSPFFMYGNDAMSIGDSLKRERSTDGKSHNGTYSTAELGVGYALPSGMTFTLGAKYQVADVKVPLGAGIPDQSTRDVTSGLIAGIAYTF